MLGERKEFRKTILCTFLLFLIVISISGCSNTEKRSSKKPNTQETAESMEETTGLRTVSVLVDLIDNAPAEAITKTLNKVPGFGEEFMYQLEILPPAFSAQERDIAITRVRTEMMAGKGPDVFLMDMTCSFKSLSANSGKLLDPLFRFPEQAMDNRLFLPLDEYMEASSTNYDAFRADLM